MLGESRTPSLRPPFPRDDASFAAGFVTEASAPPVDAVEESPEPRDSELIARALLITELLAGTSFGDGDNSAALRNMNGDFESDLLFAGLHMFPGGISARW